MTAGRLPTGRRGRLIRDEQPWFAPAAERLADGRPVLSKDEITALGHKILSLTTTKTAAIYLEHTMQSVTRMTNGNVMMSDTGDYINILFDRNVVGGNVRVYTNQVTDRTLREIARRFDEVRRDWGDFEGIMPPTTVSQDTFVPTQLWHDSTVDGMRTATATVLPDVLHRVAGAGQRAAGMLGFVAQSSAVFTATQTFGFSEETDCELSVTARTIDGKTSGWSGQAARDWSRVDSAGVTAEAIDVCARGVGAQAVEPGRRTAILTSHAVAQIMRYLAYELDAFSTVDKRNTPFYSPTHPGGARYGERMFDPRITMNSDPADPDGGYCPYFYEGFANTPTRWVEQGILKNLAWQPWSAALRGRTQYADDPHSIRISGGDTTLAHMIAQCEDGILVQQFTDVDLLDLKTGVVSGTTRDGCFLVRHGKIDRPVKNFRFLDSPFFMLNKIVALGKPARAAFGYTPPSPSERLRARPWPRLPIIVPPMMVRDFNFSSLADAV
jgi:predicted Zn-dependent protease